MRTSAWSALPVSAAISAKIGEVGAPVGVVEEAGLAIDAALDEMGRHAGQQAARPAWHA